MRKGLLITVLAVTTLTLSNCKNQTSSGAPHASTTSSSTQVDKTSSNRSGTAIEPKKTTSGPSGTVLSVDSGDLSKALLRIQTMKKRKSCNRVMGCPASIELAGLGTATEAAIIQVLRKEKGADGYWVIKCIDLLGQLGRQDSAAFLSSLLDDKRTEVRTRAAVALGRLSAPSTKEAVESTFSRVKDGPDLGFKMALLYAIDRIGPFSTQRRKDAAMLLPQDKAGLGKISPLHLITAAEVAKEWPIPEALGSLRILASHIGPFIRRQAIDALGRLKDTGAIPVLVGRLKDEVPSIRTASMRALRAITGNTEPRTEEAWEAWCSKRECRTPPPRK